jgi:hypothetical protein
MTFEEILDQALDMLRRRGRVTYGALKRQFALDDAYVADLKEAMLYADSHVVDDTGQGLRWTGEPLSMAQRPLRALGGFMARPASSGWCARSCSTKAASPIAPSNRSSALTRHAWLMSEQNSCSDGAPLTRTVRGSSGGGRRPRIVLWVRLPMPAYQPPPIALHPLPQCLLVALRKPNDGS